MRFLVIGAGGSGKTTMLTRLAANGARKAVQNLHAPIFVYLRLPSFDRDGGFDLLLDRLSLAARLDRPEFDRQWRDSRRPIVFLLDGLNEVAQAFRPSCTQALRTLLQNSPLIHSYVITSRPGDEFEAMSICEAERLQVLDIVKFRPHQIDEYLKAQGRTELKSRISKRLEGLASNPFLLWAITRTLASSRGGGPKNTGGLFRELIDRYIFQEREQSKPKPRPTEYNYELVKKPVLAQLALEMTENGITVIPVGRVRQQVAKHLLALEQHRQKERQLPLKPEVFMPDNYAAESFLHETVENGIVLREADGIRFMHQSVQDYFAAVALDTLTVEGIVGRVSPLNLAHLVDSDPIVDMFVTWAGLAMRTKLTAVVARLRNRQPFLAAKLAVEASVLVEVEKLRAQFFSLTTSEHEQRQRLGAMGLAVTGSEEPRAVARLIEMLDAFYSQEAREAATKALEAYPTNGTLSALVKAWALGSKSVHSSEGTLLRKLTPEHSGRMTDVLLEAWGALESRRDRLAELAAFLDTKNAWEEVRRAVIRDTLLTLAVEAELTGDLKRSEGIDEMRQRVERTPVPVEAPTGIAAFFASIDELNRSTRDRQTLAAAYAEHDNGTLESLAVSGESLEREAALQVLVDRRAPAVVPLIVEGAISTRSVTFLRMIASQPRDQVRRYLTARIETLPGELVGRAQLISGLLADTPPRNVLETVFRDCDEDHRLIAATVAARGGTECLDLLIEHLGNEASSEVLRVCIEVLGASRNPVAVNHLVDLLFDPVARQYWPGRAEELSSDPETSRIISADGWAALIHGALAKADAADVTLQQVEQQMRHGAGTEVQAAVHEARRWLPAPGAVELLQHAMFHDDADVRRLAQWSLACTGRADAWRALLQTELDTPSDSVGLVQDAARRLDATVTDPATHDALIAMSRLVLRSIPADSDMKRRAVALELTRRLPKQWVEAGWQTNALSTAEQLLMSGEPDQKVVAVRAIHRFAENSDDYVLTILLKDPDKPVGDAAFGILGDGAAPLLEERLRSAVRVGGCTDAQHIAGVIRKAPYYSTRLDAIRDSALTWLLNAGDCDECVAALIALAVLHRDDGGGEKGDELAKQAITALHRHGLEETWSRFISHSRNIDERHRALIRLIVANFAVEFEKFASLVIEAAEVWPDDLSLLGMCVRVHISRGNREEATRIVVVMEERFDDIIRHSWLGDQFAALDRPHDALRHYRIAAERAPRDDVAHLSVGWYAFLTGDFKESVESTERSLKLHSTNATAEFNLGLALLARSDTATAEAAYRRGGALARRLAPSEARRVLEGALGDFALLPKLPDGAVSAVDGIRTWVHWECERLGRQLNGMRASP
jgi:tetratricopeptide (TPR) repeat protein